MSNKDGRSGWMKALELCAYEFAKGALWGAGFAVGLLATAPVVHDLAQRVGAY